MDWDHAAEEHKYDDIRMLVHHRSRVHPPMSLWDRAAQFSPFAALSGHEDAIRETARLTTERAELSESRKEELNEQLVWLRKHPDARERVNGDLFSPGREKSGRCLCDSHRSGKKDRRIRKDALDGRWNRHSN